MSFKEGQDIIKKLQGEHNHSSQLLRQRVKQLEDEVVNNAARNPTLPTRQIMFCLFWVKLLSKCSLGET